MYIKKGPYLQNPKKNSVNIRWETDLPSSSKVLIYKSYFSHVPYVMPGTERPTASDDPDVFRGEAGTFHSV